jgi:hypothetical protein
LEILTSFEFPIHDDGMSALLEVRGLTVEVPTAAAWVRLVNEVSFVRSSAARQAE